MYTLQLQLLRLTFAGWVNRSQQDVIDHLQEENRVFREQLAGRRLRFTDGQRRRLAAKAIGRKGLSEIGTLVTLGSDHCNAWDGNTMGAYGNTTATNAQWTDDASSICTAFRPLYCFEQ